METTASSQTRIDDNPFVRTRYSPPGLLTPYPSTNDCRVVWAKGRASYVPKVGTNLICPRLRYDEVVYVWMDTRRLPLLHIDKIYSSESEPLTIRLDTLAKVRHKDDAIRDIAVNYDEKIRVMIARARAQLAHRCAEVSIYAIRSRQAAIAAELAAMLNDLPSEEVLPFTITSIAVEVAATQLDKGKQDLTTIGIEHDLALARAENEITLLRRFHDRRALERQDQELTARTNDAIRKMDLTTAKMLDALSPAAMVAAHAEHPELRADLVAMHHAEVTGDMRAQELAFARITALIAEVAQASAALRPHTDVLNVNQK